MVNARKTLWYVLFGALVLILGGLSGWYFYINFETHSTASIDQARGGGLGVPLFGSPNGSTQSDIEQTLGGNGSGNSQAAGGLLWEVDSTPVAGFGYATAASSTPAATLFFAERASGNVFQADPSARAVLRLTNTLEPKSYEAFFAPHGGVIERSLDSSGNITTLQASIATTSQAAVDSTSTPDELQGQNLAPNIIQLSVDPSTGALAYTIADPKGGIDVMGQPWTTSSKHPIQLLFSSPIASFRVSALSDGRIILLEDPADNMEGYAYTVSAAGALSDIASGPGLTVSPDPGSTALIYGTSAGGTLTLYAQSSPKSAPIALSLQTVADKCAWLPGKSMIAYCAVPTAIASQNFLDDWYKGVLHTSDTFWEVDASTGSTTLVYSQQSGQPPLDVQDPMIDPTGTYMAFLNGADRSLWALNIAQ